MGIFHRPADLGPGEMGHHELARVAVQLDAFAANFEPERVGDRPGRCTAAGSVPPASVIPLASRSPATFSRRAGSAIATAPLTAGTTAPLTAGTATPLTAGTATPLTAGATAAFTTATAGPVAAGTATPLTRRTATALAAGSATPLTGGAAASLARRTVASGRTAFSASPGLRATLLRLVGALALATTAPPPAPPSATTALPFSRRTGIAVGCRRPARRWLVRLDRRRLGRLDRRLGRLDRRRLGRLDRRLSGGRRGVGSGGGGGRLRVRDRTGLVFGGHGST